MSKKTTAQLAAEAGMDCVTEVWTGGSDSMEKFRKLVELEVAKEKVTPKVALPVLSEELPIDEETLRYIMAGPALAMKARIGSLEFNPMNILYELGDTILKWRGE